jgi:AraC family transcriptional regulator of adaptative response/methylated-DNA-[protein]-cysteine methyltransferase
MTTTTEQTRGEAIQFAIGSCSLGYVLAASAGAGLCAVLIGDTEAALRDELRRTFSRAILQPPGSTPGSTMDAMLRRVAAAIENPACAPDLPLELRGTPFQRHVWTALRAIPAGETRSYAEVARVIGAPKAVRAVATACAANTLAVVVPCHRVIRGDGSPSGYRWGVGRKRWLIDRERALAVAA